jgi:hypothetical protein
MVMLNRPRRGKHCPTTCRKYPEETRFIDNPEAPLQKEDFNVEPGSGSWAKKKTRKVWVWHVEIKEFVVILFLCNIF